MTICNCILDCMAQINAIEIDRSSHQNLFLKMQRLLYGAAVGLAAYYKRICISHLALNETKCECARTYLLYFCKYPHDRGGGEKPLERQTDFWIPAVRRLNTQS